MHFGSSCVSLNAIVHKYYPKSITLDITYPYIRSSQQDAHPEQIEGIQYDETFSKTMRKMWVQFAKTGDPSLSADISPDGKAKDWPLYDLKDKKVMVLDEFDIHPAKESEVRIVDWDRTTFPPDKDSAHSIL